MARASTLFLVATTVASLGCECFYDGGVLLTTDGVTAAVAPSYDVAPTKGDLIYASLTWSNPAVRLTLEAPGAYVLRHNHAAVGHSLEVDIGSGGRYRFVVRQESGPPGQPYHLRIDWINPCRGLAL